jgi:hypothetical protein
MPRIRCRYLDCVFLDDGYCSAAAVEIDPDTGCATYSPTEDAASEKDWDEEEEDIEEWSDAEGEEEDDELWLDEEEDEF